MSRPLDQVEIATVHKLLAEAGEGDLAARAIIQLEGDPLAKAIDRLEDSLSTEMRQFRMQIMVVVLVAMGINAAMIGIGLTFGVGETKFTTVPAAQVEPMELDMGPMEAAPTEVLDKPVPFLDVEETETQDSALPFPDSADSAIPGKPQPLL